MKVILMSTPAGNNFRWAVCYDEGFYLARVKEASGRCLPSFFSMPDLSLGSHIKVFAELVRQDGLQVDWTKSKALMGELIIVQSEIKGLAREAVRVFFDEAGFDEFRRQQLAFYPESMEDYSTVKGLLAEEDLCGAWDTACSEDEFDKSLWDTYFGSHCVLREPNLVPLSNLPDWLKTTWIEEYNKLR